MARMAAFGTWLLGRPTPLTGIVVRSSSIGLGLCRNNKPVIVDVRASPCRNPSGFLGTYLYSYMC